MTYLTRQFKQEYKKAPEFEDVIHWTTGVKWACSPVNDIDDDGEIEVDRVPVDVNLVAAVEALNFALLERYAVFKLDPVSEAHADRRQAVKKNWLALTKMAVETALLAAFKPCLALPHMQEFDAVKKDNLAGGLITDDQADKFFESSGL